MPPRGKAGAKPKAKAAAAAPSPPPAPAEPEPAAKPRSIADVEAHIATLKDEDWAELAGVTEPTPAVAKSLEAVLLLLGDCDAASWAVARSALEDVPALLRELRALGPWGFPEAQMDEASAAVAAADLRTLERPGTAAEAPPPSAGSRAAAAKAKSPAGPAGRAKAKAKAGAAPSRAPPDPGAAGALALGMMAEALISTRSNEKPPAFPMVWPIVPFAQIHSRLQQAMLGQQTACVLCSEGQAYSLAAAYCRQSGSIIYDFRHMQVRLTLAKSISIDGARSEVSECLKEAVRSGRRCVFLLGDAPGNLRHLCDASKLPLETFDGEKAGDCAKALGLEEAVRGFHVTLLAQLSKERAGALAALVPHFDEMAVLVLDSSSLPQPGDVETCLAEVEADKQSLRSALKLLALQPPPPPASAPADAGDASEAGAGAAINSQPFEYVESFGEDWTDRWSTGPATKDENGKEIRTGLINTKIVKYPSDPRDAKMCLQLMGGAANAPCTGIWTGFGPPIARPTEVEFEFTMNGKVDMPNACVVFTEKPFEGALPDCKIGAQFTVRGGMQLSGGGGSLVRISNDGKIKNDKWNKVLLKIDWETKEIVGQVDTRGKGYAPAVQTVPFRDPNCEGFGYLYIYNTDTQATSWFTSLRIKQDLDALPLDTTALDARREMAERMKKKEYERAVAADMEVGMKMGAIKSTAQHGMNLAQEQACNSSSAAGAAMG